MVKQSDLVKREKGIERFGRNWYVDIQTNEIRHKKFDGWAQFFNFFWRPKYDVEHLYWWSVRKWAEQDMLPHPTALEHDDIIMADFPRKYQLIGGWTITKNDLKYLRGGPLWDRQENKMLVPHLTKAQKLVGLIGQLKPLSWIVMFLLFCLRYREEIKEIWMRVINAI